MVTLFQNARVTSQTNPVKQSTRRTLQDRFTTTLHNLPTNVFALLCTIIGLHFDIEVAKQGVSDWIHNNPNFDFKYSIIYAFAKDIVQIGVVIGANLCFRPYKC